MAVFGGSIADDGRAIIVQSIHVPQKLGLLQEAYADDEASPPAPRLWWMHPGHAQSSPQPHNEGRPTASKPAPHIPIGGKDVLLL